MRHDTPRHRAGQRILQWARANKLTQEQLAERFERSQPWVSRNLIKIGPDIDYLDAIARITGRDPGDFVTWRDVDFSPAGATKGGVSQLVASQEGTDRDKTVTGPDLAPPEPVGVPPGEEVAVLSYASSPSHLALYALLGKLSETEADAVTEAILDLVRRVQGGEDPRSLIPKRNSK